MTSTAIARQKQSYKFFIIGALLLALSLGIYFYYSFAHRSVDLFTIPNPTQGLHQQKPISSPTTSIQSQK